MIDPAPPCVLSGGEASSARIEGGRDIGNIGPTEDAAMRRFPAAATGVTAGSRLPYVQTRGGVESIIV
jgi:hypothetical protein